MSEQVVYNSNDPEPVLYCAECYSLKIVHEDVIGSDCCMDCGCTTVLTAPFEEWEALYKRRYGKKFVEKSNDPKRSYLYKLSTNELKAKVYKSPKWREIIDNVYGRIPRGLNRAEALMAFFDRLIRENNIDALRDVLYKMKL